ncbi:retrotransposon protein, putative, ty1-copia subclass [Tanacetum coccineum]|uniref:Retrotransposon protein, putative, ty1-copia subclass n=1 Tax=Tanacetum coccineum TaxID=301880 RepID=A0ABQ5A0W3_9ASTR
MEWYHNLRIVLFVEDKLPFLEQPIPAMQDPPAGQVFPPDVLNTHNAWVKALKEIVGLMLMIMDPDIQKNLEQLGAYDMLKELKTLKGPEKPKKSHKAAKGNQGKGKAKMGNALMHAPSFAPKPKNPPTPKKDNPAKDAICHQCGEVGHWIRNCPVYLIELMKKKKLSQGASTSGIFTIELYSFPTTSWVYDTSCGTHICITTQGLRGSRKLKPGALSLGTISVSRLYKDGFVKRFENDNSILVSRNNLVYFYVVPRDDIYEIDLSSSNTNDSSMYAISNKRAKLNLDSTLLWYCRLRHINKKRMEKLQHNGLLDSTDIKSFEKCVSCMSRKMVRKPYSHQVKRAKDLLGLIHTDVCGPFKIMSRQGVFQKEVENQLGKTIKSLRSDRGGYPKEMMGYSFYYPPKNKVFVARNAEFLENSLITQEASGSLEDLKIIQEEDTHPSIDTSLHHEEDDQEIDEPQTDINPIRRSTRTRRPTD